MNRPTQPTQIKASAKSKMLDLEKEMLDLLGPEKMLDEDFKLELDL